jgi:hypothetical protein
MTVTSRYRRVSAANVISTITAIVVAIIVIAIILILIGANQQNMLVSWFVHAGSWLTTPFHNLFTPHGVKQNVLLNWGLAALVYAFVGGLLARLIHY